MLRMGLVCRVVTTNLSLPDCSLPNLRSTCLNSLRLLIQFSALQSIKVFTESSLANLSPLACLQVINRSICLFLCLLSSIAGAASADFIPQSRALLHEAQEAQRQLNQRVQILTEEVAKAQSQNPDLLPYLRNAQSLMYKFVGEPRRQQQLDQQLSQLAQQSEPAGETLQNLLEKFSALLKTADLIDRATKAELRAERTQIDSKMYFRMRVGSEIPPKALKAYGMMGLAKKLSDEGEFEQALVYWDRSEEQIQESFDEHIAHMAAYRAMLKKNLQRKQEDIRERVQSLLADYFVRIPAGEFSMGDSAGAPDEQPNHTVKIDAFNLGKTEVTFELYDLCVDGNGCFAVPHDRAWGRDSRPVMNVSHKDIYKRFLPWLNSLTGRHYRLPTEAEWEYAARAGSSTQYSWGDHANCDQARFDGGKSSVCDASSRPGLGTVEVASYAANAFGLFDMHGNVWEWVQDCWNPNYQQAPAKGQAWLSGNCQVRVLRGGAWDYPKSGMRSANRFYAPGNSRRSSIGFRLVIDDE